MSLLHLFPVKFGVHLFELYDNEVVLEECFNSLDYFIGNKVGQEKLLKIISGEKKESRNYKLLFEKLFENTFKKEVHGLGSFTIRALENLKQVEIDIFWSELVRKSRNDVYHLLFDIQKNYLRNKLIGRVVEQDLLISFLSTTSSDKTLRNIATENLFLISKKHPSEIIKLASAVVNIRDLNSIESIIVAICGSVLSLKNEVFTIDCLEFIANKFIPNFKNTHICIQDYIETISEFALANFKIDYSAKIVFDRKHFKLTKDKTVISSLKNDHFIHFPHLFGLDLYDFKKHQISSIASDGYHKHKTYSSVDCLAIISNVIKSKGYNETLFESIKKEFQEDKRYKYGRGSYDNLTIYPEKYLWQSYYELVGYLVLSRKLKSEDKYRYRCDYNYFDPTFPRLPQRFQIVTECFFPSRKDNIQDWINSDKQDFIDSFLIHNLNTEFDWILLSADITQEGNENDTRFQLSLDSFLIPINKIKNFQAEIERRNYHGSSKSFYNLYAGEINWSNFVQRSEEGNYEDLWGLIDVMYEFTWTGWTNNRFQNPYFKFLNPKISNPVGLIFNTDNLSFYDKKGDQKTKIVWTENAKLYYAKKELLEKLIKQTGLELIWFQFASKYGEFGKHQDNTLNPSYKDLIRLINYKRINKK
jgi:hypothetical protein